LCHNAQHAAVAQTDQGDRADSGAAISAKRAVTIWSALPTQQLGAVYDEAQIADQIARDIRLAASLEVGLQRMRRSPWALDRSTCSAG